jgi:hypothetical protein
MKVPQLSTRRKRDGVKQVHINLVRHVLRYAHRQGDGLYKETWVTVGKGSEFHRKHVEFCLKQGWLRMHSCGPTASGYGYGYSLAIEEVRP